MTGNAAGSYIVRLALIKELPRLREIELDAFATLAEARGDNGGAHALPQEVLRQSLENNLLFVAADSLNQPIAFLAGAERDRMLYIQELDVAPAWQRKGVGRQLLTVAIETARTSRLRGVTLTTDRFVPFNAPFYARLGFAEIMDDDDLPQLRQALQHEVSIGAAGHRRVAMMLRFA